MGRPIINIYCNDSGDVKITKECEHCEDVEDVIEDDAEDIIQQGEGICQANPTQVLDEEGHYTIELVEKGHSFKVLDTGGEMVMVAGFYKEKPITGYVRREDISIGLG